jgi:iron complex outermembrane receptor protein
VLTGKINDVGAYTRSNIDKSYRAGIELQGKIIVNKWLQASANIAFSENKVLNFKEFIDDYDNGGQKINQYNKSDISFSPAVVAGSNILVTPVKNGAITFINKYVSRQYLDNTSQNSRSIEGYFVQDITINYLIENKILKETNIIFQINNIFNKKYVANGYTFSYISSGLNTENYYFPMAQVNFMLGINIRL